MSIIVPAGNQKIDWSPKNDEKLTKKASTDGVEEVQAEEENSVYEAAKKFLGTKKADAENIIEVDNVVDETEEVEEKSVSEAVAEVEEKAEQAEQKIEAVEEAVEKIEDAVQGVKDAVTDAVGEEVAEIEISEVEEVPEEVPEEIPGEEVVNDEIIVETEGDVEAKTEDEIAMGKTASTEEFCKYAKLSPQNKAKLAKYWVNMLGYPKDYVNLMTKDYEK